MSLQKRVFGYHAAPSDTAAYRYDLLSAIGYVGYVVDPATGSYASLGGWDTTPLIASAHAGGTKVVLVAQGKTAADIDAVLGSAAKRQTLISTLVSTVVARGGDGVDVDFEMLPASMRATFTQFVTDLGTALRAAIPGALLSAALPAVNWTKTYDFAALAAVCDHVLIMGYDYSWAGSANAGAVAPLAGGTINVTKSVDTYLAAGVPASRLLLGVPYYGYDWETTTASANAPVKTGADGKPVRGRATTYVENAPKAKSDGRHYDATAASPWYTYDASGQPHVVWYDDEESLAAKYGLVAARNLAGIGIWTLGYQGDRPELWQAIEDAFT